MLRLFIGNKAYSSWSLRGWLAVRQSGLPYEEVVVPLYDEDWARRRRDNEFAPAGGKVPLLWDGDTVVWDSLAIVDWLADKVGRERFWPEDERARGMARSMAAEMHSSFQALRQHHSMNLRRHFPAVPLKPEVAADVGRILGLWADARSRFGQNGQFLFGDFGATDIMFAPVVTRFATYAIPVDESGVAYMRAVLGHPFMRDWIAAAQEEPWIIERFEAQPQ